MAAAEIPYAHYQFCHTKYLKTCPQGLRLHKITTFYCIKDIFKWNWVDFLVLFVFIGSECLWKITKTASSLMPLPWFMLSARLLSAAFVSSVQMLKNGKSSYYENGVQFIDFLKFPSFFLGKTNRLKYGYLDLSV